MSEDKTTYDVAQAQAALAIETDRQARAEQARREIEQVLARLRCGLTAAPTITAEIDTAAIRARLDALGLSKHLSSNRTQGLASMVARIGDLAREAA